MKRLLLQLPLFALIVAGLVIGIVTGLGRLGIPMPPVADERVVLHGPILIAGVFGTLIALERAVAMKTLLGRTWTFADVAPVLNGAGLIVLLVDGAGAPAIALMSAGAAVLVAVNLFFLRRSPALDVLTMVLGAAFLLLADLAWLGERPVPFLTPWWTAFLVLTIVGERLELAKLRAHWQAAQAAFGLAVAAYIGALLLMVVDEGLGMRLSGVGMIALTVWLLRYDIALMTIRRSGLPQFVAACLISGYIWLGVGGAVVSGFQRALEEEMDVVVKIDGDGQMDPRLLPRFIQPIINGKADFTKGSRFYSLDSLAAMPTLRKFGNAIFSLVNKVSSGYWNIMDPTNGYLAIHRRALSFLPLEKLNNGYFFESDLLFRLGTIRAVVTDIPMNSKYEDEKSHLSILKVMCTFPLLYARAFFKRVFYIYFLRDFNFNTGAIRQTDALASSKIYIL